MLYRELRVASRVLTLCFALAMCAPVQAEQQNDVPWNTRGGPGLTALNSSAEQGRFSYVLFYRESSAATHQMNTSLQEASDQLDATTVTVRVTDPREAEIVKVFGVDRAPLPLIVAVAPNGAVTKAWPLKVTAAQLREGIVSNGTAACLKAMQQQKLSLVCVHNAETDHSQAVREAAAGFKLDTRYGDLTEVIELDPADEREHTFLHRLNVSPETRDAVAVLVSPIGRPIAVFTGEMTTSQLIAKVEAAQQSCCPGGKCGPNGCCPTGQVGPQQK